MKDYYRILGVDPGADPEEIQAAYRRLIKKSHPDGLDPARRDDPDIKRRVKELNEAYEVLGDKEKRRRYDEEYQSDVIKVEFGLNLDDQELIRYLVRCGKSGRTFVMHLARPFGSGAPFLVLGFEPLPEIPMLARAAPSQSNIWRRIAGALGLSGAEEEAEWPSHTERAILSEAEIQELLEGSVGLSMGDIDWNDYACPDCFGVIENKNGTLATWIGCSKCGHIRCAGSVERTRRGVYSVCPWCGRRNRVARSVPLGKADHLTLQGKFAGGAGSRGAGSRPAAARRRFDTQTGRRLDEPE